MYLVNVSHADVFQALADPVRLRIIRVLSSDGVQEACSCDLAEALREPEYAISRQLKILRTSGLLSAEKEGRWIYHRIRIDHVDLKRLVSVINQFSDPSGEFEEDRKRLLQLIDSRPDQRCTGKASSTIIRRGPNHKQATARRS